VHFLKASASEVGALTKFVTPEGAGAAVPAAGAGLAVAETAASAKTERMRLVNCIVRIVGCSCDDSLPEAGEEMRTIGVPFYTVSPCRRTCVHPNGAPSMLRIRLY
jgi:hypothetical protein